jgi:hypothetical protein
VTCPTAAPGRVPPDWGGSLTEDDYSTLSRAWIPRELADAAMLRRVSDLEGREAIGHKGKRDCAGIYIEPAAAYRQVQLAGRDTGDSLPVTEATLKRRLKDKGLLASVEATRETTTVRRRIAGASPWWPHHDPDLFQVARRGLAAHAYRFLNPPQRPAQTPEGYDLLFLFIAQDIAHMRRVSPHAQNQRPERGLYMAGFQVIIYGRFWVFTEEGPRSAWGDRSRRLCTGGRRPARYSHEGQRVCV